MVSCRNCGRRHDAHAYTLLAPNNAVFKCAYGPHTYQNRKAADYEIMGI